MTASPPPGSAPPSWADPARAAAFDRWLAGIAGPQRLRPDTVRLASADASFRRYLRVDTTEAGLARIVMDAPPDKENSAPFVHIAQLMADAGEEHGDHDRREEWKTHDDGLF